MTRLRAASEGELPLHRPGARPMILHMQMPRRKRVAFWISAVVLAVALAALTLEGSIRLDVPHVGNRAAARFGGDRIIGLIRLVECDG
jgi:hypothetical protein